VSDPQVELNDAGDAILLWRAGDTTSTDILLRRYAADGGTGQPLRVDGYKGSQVPSTTLELSDQAAVLAIGAGDDPSYLRAHVSANGTDWDPGARLGSNMTDEAYRQQLAVAPDGRAIATWMESADMVRVFAAEYTPGSGWGAARTLSVGPGFLPQISNVVNGQAIAVWSDLADQMWFDRYVSGMGWVGAAKMLSGDKAYGPMQVTLDQSGHAWLVYVVADGSSFAVRASRLE
jgi:hypothetical protein